MPKTNFNSNQKRKLHKTRRKKYNLRRWIVLAILAVSLIFTGFFLKNKIAFYYAMYFNKYHHKNLKNDEKEAARIDKIITEYNDKTFGFDISHYQKKEDIKWDSLTIANDGIKLDFVVMRATMGNRKKDKHFDDFWETSKKNELIRGAYHFYRADEDPVMQANNYLESVKLESGDLRPVLDIERVPRRKSREKFIEDLTVVYLENGEKKTLKCLIQTMSVIDGIEYMILNTKEQIKLANVLTFNGRRHKEE